MSLSASSSEDLYKESFKYFRSFSSTSDNFSSNRKTRIKKSLKKRQNNNDLIRINEHPASTIQSSAKNVNNQDNLNARSGSGLEESSCDDDAHCGDKELRLVGENDILFCYPSEGNRKNECVKKREISYDDVMCECHKMWGLRSPETWKIVELTFPTGLIVIKNPFTPAGQRYWISRTLLDFPHHSDYITNMDNLNRLERIKKGQCVENLKDFKLDTCAKDFYQTLRWVTFGYHHDWDTKIYSEERRSTFPEDLGDMTRYISQILGFSNFEAEAAIANYYHMDSTLSGHVDRSEINQHAPLFSLSFGQSCIFLIGGRTKAERPQPVFLQSGDIAVMSGESRLSYHGVPAIIAASSQPWEDLAVINDPTSENGNELNSASSNKKQKLEDISPGGACVHNCKLFKVTLNDPKVFDRMQDTKWTDFLKEYINKSRINLNIRQVLFPEQSNLSANINTNQVNKN